MVTGNHPPALSISRPAMPMEKGVNEAPLPKGSG